MAEILVAALSHAPGLTAFPDRAGHESATAVFSAVETLATALRRFRPEVLIGVSNDHFTSTSTACVPPIAVATAARFQSPATEGLADFLGLERRVTPGHPALAQLLLVHLLAADIDATNLGGRFGFDENFAVPVRLLGLGDLPLVPVIVNAVASPMPPLRRCLAIGRALRTALADQTLVERIAVLATGGLSHSVGTPSAGVIDSDLDRGILADLGAGRLDDIASIAPEVVAGAGNGAEEIRQWLVAAAIAEPNPLETLAYEPVPAWLTGIAVACAQPRSL